MCIYAGGTINLNSLVYKPPRNGPTVWEIGIPDRSAGEFFVPKPYSNLLNRLFTNDIPDQLASKPLSNNLTRFASTTSVPNYKLISLSPNSMKYIFYDRFRQYGIWSRYSDLYPTQDLVYTVGVSNYRKDWFYAHVPR